MGVLVTEEGRRGLDQVWEGTLEGLERVKADSVSFRSCFALFRPFWINQGLEAGKRS
jgi:hypothetical protein